MSANDSGGANFDLPEEVLNVLPSDPFEQLDVARKITSIALATRVSALESEAADLRHKLSDDDSIIAELQSQVDSLDSTLSDSLFKLTQAIQEKESLLKENDSLSNTVRKLNRDVAKLESFRKTLMQSLQDEEENAVGLPKVPSQSNLSSQSLGEEEVTLPPSSPSSVRSQVSDVGNSYSENTESEAPRPRIPPGLLLASQTSTPRLTPPVSPPSLSASGSPTRTSTLVSPRRNAVSFQIDRSSVFSSSQSSQIGSLSGLDAGSQPGRTRVDGKEFFRQVRSRLSYEQFGAFLANVKELNSHKQTKEETLRKADDIFGPDNQDLCAIFEGLITRNIH